MEISWSETALVDLDTIHFYIAKDSVKYANRAIETILKRAEQIGDFPLSGAEIIFRKKQQIAYRYIVEGNYKIVYSIRENIVFIETVFDTRRNPKTLIKRLRQARKK